MSSSVAKNGTMSSVLSHNAYGKSGIRLTKVSRHADRQDFKEMTVNIQLEGDFAQSYTTGDNTAIVATDSMKNTVYALAAKNDLNDIESFARLLAEHFLQKYAHVSQSNVHIVEDLWQRIESGGKPHAHSFVGGGSEKRVATVHADRKNVVIQSGLDNLFVAKTAQSKFFGFLRDELTTLADTDDRIFATALEMTWLYNQAPVSYDAVYKKIRQVVLDVFANNESLAVQQTLYQMGEAVLAAVAEVDEITITMPNQHRLVFNLEPLGLPNKNEIFYLVDEPFGLITGTIKRGDA
ncbi:MAG: urate oxidase [Cyanobacteria bacterium REEB67]|nr:urate oxidase [Cyanobacteria bacterium REEB67]